ncbi:MAG: hypothetical protein KAJ63_10775, partial [Methyloprofundus sp.]|nr:hypothetical protein [Methyloprofundus sp.]
MLEKSTSEADDLLTFKREEKEQASEKQQHAVTALETAKTLAKSFATQDSKQKELETYLQQTDDMQAHQVSLERAEKAATIAPTWHTLHVILKDIQDKNGDIDTTETDKKAADVRIDKAKEAVALADEAYKQRDMLKAEETTVSTYQAKLESYQLLKDASGRADRQHTAALKKKSVLVAQAEAVAQTLEELKTVIDTLDKANANKAEIVAQKLMAKGRYDQRSTLEAARNELTTLNKAYQKEKIKFESAESTYNKAEAAANRTEMLWFSNQAAVLAAKLKEDQPCAVCGSLKHPEPALFSEDSLAINQQTVDRARELQAKAFKVMDTIKEKRQECLHFVTDKEKDIHDLESELAEGAHKPVAELEKVLNTLEQDLKTIEAQEKQWLKAKKQQAEKENERSSIAQDIKAFEDNIAALTAGKATAKSELDSANNTLPEHYRSSDAIKRALVDIQQKINHLENSHSTANREQTDALNNQSSIKSRLATLKSSLDELKIRQQSQALLWEQALLESDFASQEDFSHSQCASKTLAKLREQLNAYDNTVKALQTELALLVEQLKNKRPPDIEKLQQQCAELSSAFKLAEGLWVNAQQQQQKLVDTRKKIAAIETQQAAIKKQYEIVGTLSKAASGRANVRVSLERFVLGNILDQVLSTASQRLYIMSKGQYRLIRQNEETQKRNTTAGLDLAIDDAHTGKTRPVATLSGGESF